MVSTACPLREEILLYVSRQYGTEPEFLWRSHPNYAVLRHTDNRKWYAVLMDVPCESLGLSGRGRRAIMNVKCPPELLSLFLPQAGFLPAYHMHKESWLSVLLDGTVDKDTLIFLLNTSFDLTATRLRKKTLGIKSRIAWIVPANPKYYDVESDLHEGGEILWKQSNRIAVGDFVYIYVTAPTAALRYKCEVLEADIPYQSKRENSQAKRAIRLKCLQEYDKQYLPREKLSVFGVSAVRGPRRMPVTLSDEIESMSRENEQENATASAQHPK